MTLKNDLAIDLIAMESKRAFVYDDATGLPIVPGYIVKGHPTIGIGRCLYTKGLSDDEINYLFSNDLETTIAQCYNNFDWFNALSDSRKRVICNMVFQIGINGVKKFHNMIFSIKCKDWKNAAADMLDSLWATQTPLRAKRLAYVMEHDREPEQG